MKKTKLEKGITLVALIITIVVLLILAVVSIGAVKNSGIIGHAQETSNKNTVAKEKEQIILALSEWQLQKNTKGNTQSFKDVIESALKNEDVTISGEPNGPLTVTFNQTGNEYIITSNGEINEVTKIADTDLEEYILGQDLDGRDLNEIMDMSTYIFKDENNTIADASSKIKFLNACTEALGLNEDISALLYIKYNEETYKFKYRLNMDNYKFTTEADYGIKKIEVDTENTRVGKTVKYDDKTWTILYDDNENGLQMICNETYQYNSRTFQLGYADSSITNWDTLVSVADLDGNGSLDNFEKSMYSYNNAITTLNNACASVVKSNDNITDIRCVGSNPIDKNLETKEKFTSEQLSKWPVDDLTYSSGIGNDVGKDTDFNYIADFERMVALEIEKIGTDYWWASRAVGETTSDVYFYTRLSRNTNIGGNFSFEILGQVHCSYASGKQEYHGLRPVIILNSNAQLTVSQSSNTTDYVLN